MNTTDPTNFFNRETSWLEFNHRVLEEARDSGNPILERLRFFSIFHSNLDEFFMVRVASLQRSMKGDNRPDPSGLAPREQLEVVFSRVRDAYETSARLYCDELVPELGKERISILDVDQMGPSQRKYLDEYFDQEIYPVLTPIAINQAHQFPWVPSLTSNLAVLLKSENSEVEGSLMAIVQIPGRLPGLFRLPDGESFEVCWLKNAILGRLAALFSGHRILEAAQFRVTRDAEFEFDDEGSYDYVVMLESGLRTRERGTVVRLEYDACMSRELLTNIQQGLEVDNSALFPVRGPMDPRPLLSLVDIPRFDYLRYPPQPPLIRSDFEQHRNIFDVIGAGDLLLHHPYDSFDPVVQFIDAAADDPDVLAIKQTLYRSSGEGSPVLNALIRAAKTGKQVTVLVELTARFDEERNISWARDLEEAGAHVLYGVSGMKVHAKIALVVRREPRGVWRYVHLGTGNYNERTARLYTDFGLLTSRDDFGSDASGFFNTITGYSEPPSFNCLVMAPVGIREKVLQLIRREADRASAGQNSEILAKMNSLVDPKIIRELYAASKAGVKILLNVRGVCCLRPGVPGLSENISVVSIVDRYLEHSRAFIFHNGGNPDVYLSSADWMPRNLDRRVELMFPVLQQDLKTRVIETIKAQMMDNLKARLLRPDGAYERITAGISEPFRVQEYLYRRHLEEQERFRSLTPARFAPIEGRD